MIEDENQNNSLLSLLKLDYERALQLIADLHKHKIDYQKFYIGIVTVVGTVSITLVNFYSVDGIEIKGNNFKIESLIGLLLIVSALVGYAIIKNLVSIRKSEVFFNNSLIELRQQLITALLLGDNYAQLDPAKTLDRKSSDYITILVLSFVNMLFWVFGICLIYSNLETFGFTFIIVISVLGYFLVHIINIEKSMQQNLRRD